VSVGALQALARDQSWATRIDSGLCLLSAFRLLGLPGSMLDVGCGRGHLVEIARALGVEAVGLDIALEEETDYLLRVDLTREAPGEFIRFDLVLCLEVAEHLPPEAADVLCDRLAGSVASSGCLLFSAATPGQGGAGHLNEQPRDYWRERLTRGGRLVYDPLATARVRSTWLALAPRAWWYGRNAMVFRWTAR